MSPAVVSCVPQDHIFLAIIIPTLQHIISSRVKLYITIYIFFVFTFMTVFVFNTFSGTMIL